MDRADDVLQFWFPPLAPDDQQAMPRQLEWWFRRSLAREDWLRASRPA
jgi:hypothetical protein